MIRTLAEPQRTHRRAYAPMLATSGPLPQPGDRFAFEFKWDGVRCILQASDGSVRLFAREGADITSSYPEIVAAAASLSGRSLVLDGEIVALDAAGRPSFSVLQRRMHERAPSAALVASTPVTFFAFDLLESDGRALLAQPYRERRRLLEALHFKGPHWLTAPSHRGEGEAVLEASRAQGLEGVVAKALDGPYRPGVRSDEWIKVKNRHQQEFVVGGWTRGQGLRSTTFGALLVGYYRGKGRARRLVYAGRVGTGFDDEATARLEKALKPLRRADSPFSAAEVPGDPVFVEPRLVVDVEFANWTPDGILRHSSFRGLRTDKDPLKVVREDTQGEP